MVFVKSLRFSIFFFWKVGEKNMFDDILHRKTAFLDLKNIDFRF